MRGRPTAEVVEDVEWIVHDATLETAAARLGMTQRALVRALERSHRRDLLAQLRQQVPA